MPGKTEGVIFCPVPVEVTYFEPERVGVELLNKTISTESEGRAAPMVPDLVRIGDMLAGVENVVDRLLQYVEDVMVSVGRRRRIASSPAPYFSRAQCDGQRTDARKIRPGTLCRGNSVHARSIILA